MSKIIPDNVQKYLEPLPKDRTDKSVMVEIKKFSDLYGENYVETIIWTLTEAANILVKLGINNNTTFYNFYLNKIDSPDCYRSEEIYGLGEIYEDYKNPFWKERYPSIDKKTLQLSSIEGEYSYFYNKETDQLYGVDWEDMDKFMSGELVPLFITFYDFIEWYFSEEDEE